jgi:uncharacterized membrane protein
MSRNPFANALVASGYISLLVTLFFYLQRFSDNELGLMAPMLALSLLVLSAAIMGYLFVYQPALLIMEGKESEGTKLFLSTVFAFACITIVIILAWYLLSAAL